MFYQYAITFHFRNGKILEIHGNQCSTFTDPGGISLVMVVDKKIVAELPEGIGNSFSAEETLYYNAFPRKDLYDYFPADWDIKNGRFNLIDKINVNALGREVDPSKTKKPATSPGGGC